MSYLRCAAGYGIIVNILENSDALHWCPAPEINLEVFDTKHQRKVQLMKLLLSHVLILLYCLISVAHNSVTAETIAGFLCAVTVATLFYFFQNSRFSKFLLYAYALCALFFPPLYLFLPLLFFELARLQLYPCMLLLVGGYYFLGNFSDISEFLFLLLGCAIAFFLEELLLCYATLEEKYRHMRDDSTEKNLLLKAHNQSLLDNQDYEIHNATLQERNRIAREIHDNVGHMLSRCILMTGALKTINKDENCTQSLLLLENTLSQAMDNIRTSVHNLHDDSINLHKNLQTMIADFTFCPTHLEYDMQGDVPSAVRYAFISITKEALTNTAKHSNATAVTVTVREHPAMYQLIIHDNGTNTNPSFSFDSENAERQSGSGIGLINIADRVKLLKGRLQISCKRGFQIFVSIPKESGA